MSTLPTIVRGQSLSHLVPAGEYPASAGWAATLYLNFRAGGAATIAVTGSAVGADHLLEATAATTANWQAGDYAFEIWVVNGAQKVRIQAGQLAVRASVVGLGVGVDTRTQAEKAVADLKAAIAAWSPTTRRYSIAGREMEFRAVADILTLLSFWQQEVRREQAAQAIQDGTPTGRKVYVRMGRA